MKKLRCLLILPNYDQNQELVHLLPELLQHYPAEDILFVDDGSRDGSIATARSHGLKVFAHSKNQGIGAAIRSGIQYAEQRNYGMVCIFSTNGKMRPDEIRKVIAPVQSGEYDYVTGSRFAEGGSSPGLPAFRHGGIHVFSKISSLFLGRRFSDITCGFRAYRMDWLLKSKANLNQEWLNRYELEYYLHYFFSVGKARMLEVPVTIRYNHLTAKRRSKIRPITGWWSMVRPFFLLKMRLKN